MRLSSLGALAAIAAAAAVAPLAAAAPSAPDHRTLTVRRTPAPALAARGKACDSSALSLGTTADACAAGEYCSADGLCSAKLAHGSSCSSDAQCFSRSCDSVRRVCDSHSLSAGSACSSSMACASGNCFRGRCVAKLGYHAYCYKDANCQSAYCDPIDRVCAQPPVQDGYSPVAHIPDLQPTLPLEHDVHALEHLEPGADVRLFYTNHGTQDLAAHSFVADLKSLAQHDVVVLTHSAAVGRVACPRAGALEIPFTSAKGYAHAAAHWARTRPFVLVAHAHGCGAPTEGGSGDVEADEDERTFWLAHDLHFDDGHLRVTAQATQLDLEQVLDEVTLTFGQYEPDHFFDQEHLFDHEAFDYHHTETPARPAARRALASSSPLALPAGDEALARRAGLPGSCAAAPAGLCGATFDQQLDDALGYYDFDGDLSNALQRFMPGLNIDYSAGALADPDVLDVINDIPDDAPNGASARRRRSNADLWARAKKKSGGVSIFKAIVKSVSKSVAKTIKSIAKDVIAAKGNPLKTAKALFKHTPLGMVYGAVTGSWTPSISGTISMGWYYTDGEIEKTEWGNQPKIWGIDKQKQTTKVFGKDAPTTARLAKKQGNPYAKTRAEGSLALYCVNCHVKGKVGYKGTLGFKLLKGEITQMSVDYAQSFDARLQFGLEAQILYQAELRKTIIAFPLPGGLAIKGVVTVGPGVTVETSAVLRVNAQADILLGAALNHSTKHHLDMIHPDQSYTKGTGLVFTAIKDVKGSAQASVKVGLPVSLVLGCSIKPLKIKRDIALTAEPAIVAAAMVSTDTDDFEKENLPVCTNGLGWGVNTGIAFSLNLFNWSKRKLGKWDGPSLANGCIDFGFGPVVNKMTADQSKICPDGSCTCTIDDYSATCQYRMKGKDTLGLMGQFIAPCDGSLSIKMQGGQGGWNAPQGFRAPGYLATSTLDATSGKAFKVQLGGRGNVYYLDNNWDGGWPNGGGGTPSNGGGGGGGGSSELIDAASGNRLVVAGGAGGNSGGSGPYPGQGVDGSHLTGSPQGGSADPNSGESIGGGGGGLQGGQAGFPGHGGYAGSSRADSVTDGALFTNAYADITYTCV